VNTVIPPSSDIPAIPAKAQWPVAVSFRKRPIQSKWADFEWEAADCTMIEFETADETRWTYNGEIIDLHNSEGEGYWLNLNSPAPCVFVMWRIEEGEEIPKPIVTTVSYNEAGRMLDAGDHVDNVPMPEAMRAALIEYVNAHYTPEVRNKVRRNDPFKEGAYRSRDGGSGGHGDLGKGGDNRG
jgi:hypothetical protein